MSDKKNKALERELMDDLLEDQTDALKKASDEAKEISIHVESDKDEASLRLENEKSLPDFSAGFGSDTNSKKKVLVSPRGGDADKEEMPTPPPKKAETVAKKVEATKKVDSKKTVAPKEEVSKVPATAASPTKTSKVAPSPDDATVRLNESRVQSYNSESDQKVPAHAVDDEVRASVGRFGAFRNTSSPTGAALAQSENLRIAQGRILELEQEVERLRVENEELAAAGETFRRKSDELSSKAEDLDNRYQNAVTSHSEEKALLLENKESLRRELDNVKAKNEDLELRISTNIQKIRVRERELENRLELVKMEGAALIRSKDEMILDLKRQIDQFGMELNNYRTKSQELNRMILDKQDILRRTVKALRLALTMLEGDEEASAPLKKAK